MWNFIAPLLLFRGDALPLQELFHFFFLAAVGIGNNDDPLAVADLLRQDVVNPEVAGRILAAKYLVERS